MLIDEIIAIEKQLFTKVCAKLLGRALLGSFIWNGKQALQLTINENRVTRMHLPSCLLDFAYTRARKLPPLESDGSDKIRIMKNCPDKVC